MRRARRLLCGLLILPLAAASGCSKGKEAPPGTPPATAPVAASDATGATAAAPAGDAAAVAVADDAAAAPAPAPAGEARPLYYERALTAADLDGRTLRELSLMRNTIFARVGN